MNIRLIKSKRFIKLSKEEFKKYKKTKKIENLQEAGEKCYVAYIYLLEYMICKNIKSHKQIYPCVVRLKDKNMLELLKDVEFLHTFFYESETTAKIVELYLMDTYKRFDKIFRKC